MDFLSQQLVSSDYRHRLQNDLRQASVCRFLVAYISSEGINSIGRSDLVKVLRHQDSFGIGSLSCCCGFEPLVDLHRQVGESEIRLKYFMDPKVKYTDEPDGIVLFHSKLVYLYLPSAGLSVVYLGSHNWTSRALGPGRPRNAEASVRFELPYSPDDLQGVGPSIASEVNRHLLSAYNKAVCLPATSTYREVLEEWYEWSCNNASPSPLELVTIILAVRKGGPALPPSEWSRLAGSSVYMPLTDEREGQRIREDNRRIVVMVWDSVADLVVGNQPVLMRCHLSTQDPGPTSAVRGTNQSPAPIAGFRAVLLDEAQLSARQNSQRRDPSGARIWSQRDVEYYDFEFPTARTDSSAVDGGIRPNDRFLLEIDDVIFPADGPAPDDPSFLWTRESFAVAKKKNDAKLERIQGYRVPADLKREIIACLTEEFKVDPTQAKSLPVSDYDVAKEGRRVSSHPLHDTFIGPDTKRRGDDFYVDTERGSLVANLDDSAEEALLLPEGIHRVERLYTMKLEQLKATWSAAATKHKTKKRDARKD